MSIFKRADAWIGRNLWWLALAFLLAVYGWLLWAWGVW